MEERKVIYTYNKAWGVEKTIHHVGNINLPVPLAIDSLLYGFLGVIIALVLHNLPLVNMISPLLLFGGCTFGLPYLMKKARIHSKTPTRFLMGYFSFLGQPKSIARFRPIVRENPIRFSNVRRG